MKNGSPLLMESAVDLATIIDVSSSVIKCKMVNTLKARLTDIDLFYQRVLQDRESKILTSSVFCIPDCWKNRVYWRI